MKGTDTASSEYGCVKARNDNGMEKTQHADGGFSLVEVLVCIAILAIISIPLFSGLRLSAKLNYNAHYVQMVTAHAQEEMETVLAVGTKQYKDWVSKSGHVAEITSGEAYERAQAAKIAFASSHPEVTQEELNPLFTPFECVQDSIVIGGKNYSMKVIFEPALYSRENSADDAYAYDINVSGFGMAPEADAACFPVVSEELNRYEAVEKDGAGAVIFNIQRKLNELGKSVPLAEIHNGMQKEIQIKIGKVTDGKIKVEGYVAYTYDTVELEYKVYSATYPYQPGLSPEGNADNAGTQSGGSVFIFARALQNKAMNPNHRDHCYNSLKISVLEDTLPVNIYFMRGHFSESEKYNFDEITVSGADGVVYDYMNNLSGSMSGGNWTFHTNVKNAEWDLNLLLSEDAGKETLLGREKYAARCYQVTIEIYDEEGKKVADMKSSKIE